MASLKGVSKEINFKASSIVPPMCGVIGSSCNPPSDIYTFIADSTHKCEIQYISSPLVEGVRELYEDNGNNLTKLTSSGISDIITFPLYLGPPFDPLNPIQRIVYYDKYNFMPNKRYYYILYPIRIDKQPMPTYKIGPNTISEDMYFPKLEIDKTITFRANSNFPPRPSVCQSVNKPYTWYTFQTTDTDTLRYFELSGQNSVMALELFKMDDLAKPNSTRQCFGPVNITSTKTNYNFKVQPNTSYLLRIDANEGVFAMKLGQATVATNDKENTKNGFNLYPNPITDTEMLIDFEKEVTSELSYSIFDIMGNRLQEGNIDNFIGQKAKITLSAAFANGMYILSLKNKKIEENKRFVIQR